MIIEVSARRILSYTDRQVKMGKIFYMMGKSSSGKDTIYNRLLQDTSIPLKKIVLYTTRPIRASEMNGREYFFVTAKELHQLEAENKVMECRTYNTVCGDWHYFTVDDKQIDLKNNSYLMIGTITSFQTMKKFYNEDHLVPIYIESDDGIRLERALKREKKQEKPQYAEMCRRFLADNEDFMEQNIQKAGITIRFINDDLETCIKEIAAYIRKKIENDDNNYV